jgi:hypothetical protein
VHAACRAGFSSPHAILPAVRLRSSASTSKRAAMALARLCHVTPREALSLLREPRVLPFELDTTAAAAACEALRAEGVEAAPVDVPPTSSRCGAHPALTGEAPCEDCRTLVCPLCLPHCGACAARRATAARWKRLRVAVLLLVLLGVAAWGLGRQRALDRRNAWLRPLYVAVVLVSSQPVDDAVHDAWSAGLAELDDWFAAEAERLQFHLARPVHFELAPGAVQADAPSPAAGTGSWVNDSKAALEFRAALEALATRAGASGAGDVRVVVALRPGGDGAHRVEGIGEAGGSVGLVEGTAGDTAITLELVAVAHEVLHLVGAADGYDAKGHAQVPRGYVEPERGLPQRFAEVMVGELPLGETEARIPRALDEVRIGDVTAAEIGWRR